MRHELRTALAAWLAGVAIGIMPVGGETNDSAESSDGFARQAAELVEGRTTRFGKLVAVHSFTRDEIREVTTRYS